MVMATRAIEDRDTEITDIMTRDTEITDTITRDQGVMVTGITDTGTDIETGETGINNSQ
jgi:hypothetical protein